MERRTFMERVGGIGGVIARGAASAGEILTDSELRR
jgi:hypothetical protein